MLNRFDRERGKICQTQEEVEGMGEEERVRVREVRRGWSQRGDA